MAKAPLNTSDLKGVVGGAYQQGTEGGDLMPGTDQADAFFGNDGNDTLNGAGGADYVEGGAGDDWMDGGASDGTADIAVGGTGNDGYGWGIGDGSDTFHGGEGSDALVLRGMNIDTLNAGLQVEGGWAKLAPMPDGSGGYQFVNAWTGAPAENVAGSITAGGQTLTFTGVERLYFA